MTLSKHVDAEALESEILKKNHKTELNSHEEYIFKYSSNSTVPKYEIPDESSSGDLVYQYLSEELSLDGVPTLNLASFVNTTVDETQLKLISDNIVKNLADNDEYPSLIEFQQRCITILGNLWHAPKYENENGKLVTRSVGTATTGLSEAIMLAGLALKKRWQEKRKAEGKSTDNPNIIMATCAQVALEKFARYFDIENRLVHINQNSGHLIDVSQIESKVDENTIGIFVILGSTFTGAFEPVAEISNLLDKVQSKTGNDVRIHVDGASGGFVAPFVFPGLKWDFLVPRVDSINTSGHKFGLTSAGLGWVIWKHEDLLPKTLKFSLDYLGGVEETFGLNFSRPGFPVIHQYYNFLTLGREGYTKIFDSCLSNARLLSNFLEESKYFDVLSVIHKPVDSATEKKLYPLDHGLKHDKAVASQKFQPGLPVVAFRFSKELRKEYPEIPQSIFGLLLRNKGYIIPNYHLPPDEGDVEILRVVVRDSVSLNLLDKLMQEIVRSIELLIRSCAVVRDVVKEDRSEKERSSNIYKLLLSIASSGTEDIKQIQHEVLDVPGTGHGKHKRSYRGPC
ncbi:glutamate decarboxylase [Suhomyces tanzawaensis NRRL Y-17324]|uniref:Glutamate decarboxylase n=1 Tax=Suhomyces tanzawaensis NRRL Y-17324 TaxID=984487 RepID=A0A1E4SEP7_9ASCO|nr:glutamate decarboxylase [Suhomyces tanzawaensis NRRL Y-17324]ODV77936.1 glutamate decarboxylase [Suhomyces tanzawaensis NRRL Y-17324]